MSKREITTEKNLGAGLLWVLLDKGYRRKVAGHLESEELTRLNSNYQEFKELKRAHRKSVEQLVLGETRMVHGYWPFWMSLASIIFAGGLFVIHAGTSGTIPMILRLKLFVPLLLGTLSFLMLYLVPRYQWKGLFSFHMDWKEALALPVSLIGLLWILAYIQFDTKGFVYHPRGLDLIILLTGAMWAPLLEELVFRQIIPEMLGGADRYLPHALAVILFAVGHLPGTWEEALLYLIAGAFLALLRLLSDGLFYPLVIHSVANGVTVLLSS